jgi:hypothetical protein
MRAASVSLARRFSSRYACVASSYLIEVSVVCGIPGNRGVPEGISLSFAVSSALWLRVDFLPERACSLMYSALPAHSALPTDGTDPEGSQLAVVDFFDPAVQCPTSVGRCTPQTPEDRLGTARVTVGYDVGALIEHPLEPWKVSMLAGGLVPSSRGWLAASTHVLAPNLLPRRMCRPTHTAGHTFPPSTILKIGAAIAPLHRAVLRAGYTHIRRPGVSYGYVAWRCSAEPVRRGWRPVKPSCVGWTTSVRS